MDGAANEKERRPFADQISGTVRRNLSMDVMDWSSGCHPVCKLSLFRSLLSPAIFEWDGCSLSQGDWL